MMRAWVNEEIRSDHPAILSLSCMIFNSVSDTRSRVDRIVTRYICTVLAPRISTQNRAMVLNHQPRSERMTYLLLHPRLNSTQTSQQHSLLSDPHSAEPSSLISQSSLSLLSNPSLPHLERQTSLAPPLVHSQVVASA